MKLDIDRPFMLGVVIGVMLFMASISMNAQNASPWVRLQNLLSSPSDFTATVGWQDGSTTTVTGGQTDPNSGTTATLVTLGATNSANNYVRAPLSILASTAYTLEITAKQTVGTTNLISSPTNFTVAPWQQTGITFTTGQSDPLGGTAATLAANNTGGSNDVRQPFTSSANTPYTVTLTAKKSAGTDWIMIGLSDYAGNASTSWFNLATGAIGTTTDVGGASGTYKSITSLGSGWYTCSVTVLQIAVAGYVDIRIVNGDGSINANNGGAAFIFQPILIKANVLMVGLSDYAGNAFSGYFDLVNGVVGTTSAVGTATVTSSSIASAGSGWYTCTLKGVSGSTSGLWYLDTRVVKGDTSLTGQTGTSALMWHPQLWQGSTSYAWGATISAIPKYSYFGFYGAPVLNWFRYVGSDDAATWTGAAGFWGTPSQINAPQVLYYKGQYFFHVAQANDTTAPNFNQWLWYVGKADTSATVSVVATIDWSAQISSLYSCYSGMWFVKDDGSRPYLLVPCSASDNLHMVVYITQAQDDALTSWSNPTAVTISGGASSYYDPKPFLIGTTYYLWVTRNTASQVDLATASTLAGPYTILLPNVFGAGLREGLAMVRTETGWRTALESLPSHQMQYSDCNSIFPDVCTWTALTNWTEGLLYRHGSIIRTIISPAGMMAAGQ